MLLLHCYLLYFFRGGERFWSTCRKRKFFSCKFGGGFLAPFLHPPIFCPLFGGVDEGAYERKARLFHPRFRLPSFRCPFLVHEILYKANSLRCSLLSFFSCIILFFSPALPLACSFMQPGYFKNAALLHYVTRVNNTKNGGLYIGMFYGKDKRLLLSFPLNPCIPLFFLSMLRTSLSSINKKAFFY
jgi:hypothetical protein